MKKSIYWLRILFNIFLIPTMLISSSVNSNGELSIRPSLSVGEVYTSNSTDSSDPEEKKSDFISSVVPGFSLSHSNRLVLADVGYSLDSKFYHNKPELSYYGHSGYFSLNKELSKNISIKFNDSMGYTKSSGDLPVEENAAFTPPSEMGLKTKRTGRFNNSSSLTASFKSGPLTSMTSGISESMLFLEDQDLVDTRTDSVYFAWNRQFLSSAVNFGYDFSTYSYNMYDYSFDSKSNSIGNHSAHLGFVNNFIDTISLELSGGSVYTVSNPEPLLNWSGSAGFTKKLQNGSIRAAYSRGVSSTGGLNKEVSINQSISGGFTFNTGKSVSVSITASGSDNRSTPSEDIKTSSYSSGVNINWTPKLWLTINAGYSHFQQWAEKLVVESFSRDQVTIHLTIMPEGWKF